MLRFLILILFPAFLFSAAVVYSPTPIENGKFNTGVFYDINTNNIFFNFSIFAGFGLPDNKEISSTIYANGILCNLKGIISRISPFTVSGAFELGYDLDNSFNTALYIFLNVDLYEFLSIYIGASGRYPSVYLINISGRKEEGVTFIPFLGMEFGKNSPFSFLIQSGLSFSWVNQLPQIILSSGLTYRF